MNSCEEHRHFLVECDWTEGDLQRAVEAMAHLQSCPACAATAAEFNRLRSLLRNENEGLHRGAGARSNNG